MRWQHTSVIRFFVGPLPQATLYPYCLLVSNMPYLPSQELKPPAVVEVQPEVASWLRSKGRTLKLIKEMTGVTLSPGSCFFGAGWDLG